MKTILLCLMLLFTGCTSETSMTEAQTEKSQYPDVTQNEELSRIYLAGGCFWGVEAFYDRIPGVSETISGYANGTTDDPTYEKVIRGDTGHAETVDVVYDPNVVSLEALVTAYLRIIDPFAVDRQGNDIGNQYRTGIFTLNDDDLHRAMAVVEVAQKKHEQPFAIVAETLSHFTRAEDYHQDYLIKNPNGYCHTDLSIADQPLYPGDYVTPSDEELKQRLTPLQYDVVRNRGTERAFQNEYDKETRAGLYVDITNGQPLFSSEDKFDSGTGWPSFTKPITPDAVSYVGELSPFGTEVVARESGGHLGHVFGDGPQAKGGQRYCMNSAAMRFIPLEEMGEAGYGDLIPWIH